LLLKALDLPHKKIKQLLVLAEGDPTLPASFFCSPLDSEIGKD